MINIHEIIRQMTVNAEAIQSLVKSISDEQTQWKPRPEVWCMKEVMEHLYNEERGDFRAHIKEILSDPTRDWGSLQEGYVPVKNCIQGLEGFLTERKASLQWLAALDKPDWDRSIKAPFGPSAETLLLSAGDVLVSWVAHDYLHIRQINELLFAWNEKQASPYSVQYAGGW